MAGEDLKAARLHPVAKIIAKYPLIVALIMFALYFGLAFIGAGAIEVTFGNPSGRTAYSPTDRIETARLDMYINAQRTVEVKAESTERQTVSSAGITIFFEEETADGQPALDAPIFTEENLEIMRRAQRIIEADPDYDQHCFRCRVEKSVLCRRSNSTYEAALALEAAIEAEDEDAATDAAEVADGVVAGLCDLEAQTCRLRPCTQAAVASIAAGAMASNTSRETLLADTRSCLVLGARLTAEGACLPMPGCEDATEDEHKCVPMYSPLNYFCKGSARTDEEDGCESFVPERVGWRRLDAEIDEPDAQSIQGRISVFPANFFLPSYYEKGDRRAHTTRMSSLMGLPIHGFEDANDRTEQQEDLLAEWMIGVYPKIEALREEVGARLSVRWIAPNAVINHLFQAVLGVDVTLALGAIFFVFFYILFHTRSLFISASCILGIILCFPVGAFWSIVVFGVRFFDPLNVFLLFVLLGLGADGVFIVFDAWEQSFAGVDYWTEVHGEEVAKQYRMSYVWRRSSRAMFACNGTTALAFLSVVPSPIMPMASFGILSALTILHNWLLDVTVVPCILALWDERLRHNYLCCCLPKYLWEDRLPWHNPGKPRKHTPPSTPGNSLHRASPPQAAATAAQPAGATAAADPEFVAAMEVAHAADMAKPEPPLAGGLNKTEMFFRDKYAPFILRFRLPIVAVMALFIGTMVYFTTQLRAATESPQFLPDQHPLWKAIISLRDGWMEGENENRGELWMVWGVKGNDYGPYTKFDFGSAECNDGPCGEAIFDDTFDPSSKSMQKYLLDACEEAAKIKATRGPVGGDFIYDEKISNCLMKDFRGWLRARQVEFPIDDAEQFWKQLDEYLREPDEDTPAGEGYKFVQSKLVRVGGDDGKGRINKMYFLISGVYVDYLPQLFYGLPEIEQGLAASYHFEAEFNEERPKGQPPFFVTTSSGLFAAMRMQEAYISSTVSGVLTALAFALASLVVFVANVFVALLAFLCIAGVVCCTLGLMVLQGWALGPIEAICATVVVGFSVDYVVHYALAYVSAPHEKRAERLTFALVEVGISVQAGAITTMGASAFLLFTTIQFFFKFGVFMLSTVFFSLLTANLAFTSLLALVGPEGDRGDLCVLIQRARSAIAGSRGGGKKGAADAPPQAPGDASTQ